MGRPATGQVLRRDGGSGGGVFALRFQAYGRRRYVTLGTAEDGWTDQRARDELERTMQAVRAGTWSEHSSPLRSIVAEVLAEADDEDLRDGDVLAIRVLDASSEDVLQGELLMLVRRLVTQVAGEQRRDGLDPKERKAVDLDVIVHPAGDTKRLGDCTVADIDTLAYEQESRARDLLLQAAQFRSLSAEMRSRRVATVRDLGAKNAMDAIRRGKPYKILRNDELSAAQRSAA